ncbi:MAG: hypothetical protein JNK64_41545 [Myxococcales bacterium]|nr:hypothetical protein [Myxococcales bacterium]
MNMNVMSFLVGKSITSDLGEERSTQLGLIAGLMPGYQGVLLAAIVARQETPPTPAPTDPKTPVPTVEALLATARAPTGK